MDFSILIAYSAALFAAGLALAATCQHQRSLASWLVAGGLFICALGSLFVGLAADALQPVDFLFWSRWRFICMAFVPGLWFLFTLTYSRGNARSFLNRWRWLSV